MTFTVTYTKGEEQLALECDRARMDEIWQRIQDAFCAPLTPEDLVRFAGVVKRYPPPDSGA